MSAQMLVDVIVFVLFALLGMWLVRRIRAPRNRWIRLGLLIVLVIAPALGADIRLLEFVITAYFSVALQGIVFGLVAGWWAKK